MTRNWDFDTGTNRFSYEDDLFGQAETGRYAGGKHAADAGKDGALQVRLGGKDDNDVADMSGGWTRTFTTDEAGYAEITLRFKMTASAGMESDEHGEVRLALDGDPYGLNGKDHLARLSGDGGERQSTGWQEVTVSLGWLEAGRHELDIGGALDAKTAKNEKVKILFDDVRLDVDPDGGDLDAFEAEVLDLTNEFRAEHGLDPLEADFRLAAAAESWSQEMADRDKFEHSDTAELVEEQGYAWSALGENIAAGYATPEDVVEGWIGSPGHRANLLNESFEEIGIGYVHREDDGGDAPYGHYWTQVFATEAESLI